MKAINSTNDSELMFTGMANAYRDHPKFAKYKKSAIPFENTIQRPSLWKSIFFLFLMPFLRK